MLQHVQSKGRLGSIHSIPHVIALMSVPAFRPFILQGAVASIGGVDQNLSQVTADALSAIVTAPDRVSADNCTGETAGVNLTPLHCPATCMPVTKKCITWLRFSTSIAQVFWWIGWRGRHWSQR